MIQHLHLVHRKFRGIMLLDGDKKASFDLFRLSNERKTSSAKLTNFTNSPE